jgi:hypothetical protein
MCSADAYVKLNPFLDRLRLVKQAIQRAKRVKAETRRADATIASSKELDEAGSTMTGMVTSIDFISATERTRG